MRKDRYESGAVGIQSGKHTENPFQIVLTRLIWSSDAKSAPISISGLLTAKSSYGIPFLQSLAISSQINLNEKSSKQTPLNKTDLDAIDQHNLTVINPKI